MQNKKPSQTLSFWLATWFGAGLLPRAPGTWGSLAALPFAWAIVSLGGIPALAAASLGVFLVGWWAASSYARLTGGKDPQDIVIDEVAGQWLLLLAAPLDPLFYLMGFVLFRALDIWKPWPANWADRHVEGGLGIMLDDVLAALWGLPVLWGLARYWP
jgi:phosphatidylglycerophosphatase A